MPKLCCVLNTEVDCRACKGVWCWICWYAEKQYDDDGRHPPTKRLYFHEGSFRRLCKDTSTEVTYASSRHNKLTLELLKE